MGKLRNMTSVYLWDDDGVLMLHRRGSRIVDGLYVGSAGGHFEEGELNDARACVLREMGEELGLGEADVEAMTLRYVTLRLKDGEIRQNYYFFARVKERRPLESTEGRLQWVPYAQLEALPMPVSAKAMLLHYLRAGRYDRRLYGAVTQPEGTRFVPLEDFPG